MSDARSKGNYPLNGGYLVSRRALLQLSTFSAAGMPAGQGPVRPVSLAQQARESRAPAAGNTAVTVKAIYEKARQALHPLCRVCPECDGVACAGEVPGFGGLGSGMSFQNNFHALQRVRLNLRTLTDVLTIDRRPDTSITIFGQKFSFPAIAAPIGGVRNNFAGRIGEEEYLDAIIGGCVDAGSAGAFGDGQTDPIERVKARFDVVARHKGKAIAGIKPRPNANFLKLIPLAEAAGTFMITIDMDSAGRYARNPVDAMVGPKTVSQLGELVRATRIPFVVKGIMTPDEALKARDAGAAGIVVSNHGGRALDHTPGTAEVLPAIADKVKGKIVIFVDGCVHYGHDVLKYLALGADAVLVGRHLVRAAFGGGREGVALFMRTMREELEAGMVLTGVPNVSTISRRILA
jgi:4-hydroxymandelate oxidase